MRINNLQPLVVTPSVEDRETLWAYLIRVAELNGYERPLDILRYAGISEREARCVNVPVDRIEPLLMSKEESLVKLKHTFSKSNHDRSYKVLGHTVEKHQYSYLSTKICPECIVEKGYIDVLWGFKYVDGCDLHKRRLVDSCPHCKKKLSRHRGGLLRCRCQGDLTEVRGDPIESEVEIQFLQMMRLKINGQSIDKNIFRKAGFPVDEIKTMSVATLSTLINRLPSWNEKTDDVDGVYSISNAHRAASVFSNWPVGFYGYLSGLGKNMISRGVVSTSYKRQFYKIHYLLRASHLIRDEAQFIYDAFIHYGINHWKTAMIDKRMCREYSVDRKIIGLNELAERMRVQPSTAKHMIDLGIIRVEKIEGNKRPTYLFDLSYKLPFKNGKGSGISSRESAKYVELPVSVLNQLRDDGVYTINYIPDKLKSFHIMDLDRFRNQMLSNVKPVDESFYKPNLHVYLKDVMRMKMGGASIKAKLVACTIDRSISVEGVINSSIEHIILLRDEVNKKVKQLKEMSLNSLLVTDAAKELSCDPTAIPDLVARGYLDSIISSTGVRITENSLRIFMSEYASCKWIACQLDTSSRKIIVHANEKEIELLNVKRTHSKSHQPFVKKESLDEFGLYD